MPKSLTERVADIETRNKRVELDKAWEISLLRRILISILTYIVIVIFMFSAEIERPFVSAIVPSIGFIVSTLTITKIKSWWIKRNNNVI